MSEAIAIYLRVSTSEQAISGLGLEAQASACRRYADISFDGASRSVFEEHASAASIAGRPVLSAILAEAHQFAHLVVMRLDRLARNTFELLSILRTLSQAGCQLHSVTERLDTSSPSGKVIVTLLAAFAEYERDLISTRTRDAMRQAKIQGRHLGRRPFGFAGPGLVPDPARLPIALRCQDLWQAGFSSYRIAALVGLPVTTVKYLVRNPIYQRFSPPSLARRHCVPPADPAHLAR